MLVPQRQGPPIVMDEIPRTYYPGRGFLTDQQAYPTDPFNRAPRYGGGFSVPGAAGNLAGSLLGQMPQFIRGQYAPQNAILKVPHLDSPYIDEQIRRGFAPMTPPVRRSGPQLPGFV